MDNYTNVDDSKDRTLGTWEIYGLFGVLIVIYSTNIVIKSNPEYLKKLWIFYILLAVVLGYIGY